jgi:hypothetical protein
MAVDSESMQAKEEPAKEEREDASRPSRVPALTSWGRPGARAACVHVWGGFQES